MIILELPRGYHLILVKIGKLKQLSCLIATSHLVLEATMFLQMLSKRLYLLAIQAQPTTYLKLN
ncbi:MAG TPA: hypothetical protein DGJ56_08610 [Verrucomicrobiales bacterium]|nr:hypothetical protein [Verrucomicrobiales bacterium]